MTQLPKVGDSVFIQFNQIQYLAKIESIMNTTLYLKDSTSENRTSLTWNGTNWTFPNGAMPNHVAIMTAPVLSQCLSPGRPKVVDVHVGCIRPEYNDLEEWVKNPNNVYIGRRGVVFVNGVRFPLQDSKFANPYKEGKDGTLTEVIEKYKTHLHNKMARGEITREDLLALKGKTLGCWCKSKHEECHGEVIAEEVAKL